MSAGADHVEPIRVESIIVMQRLRPLREDVVNEIVESIQKVGLINPITICRPNGHAVPHLVSGRHRLEAAHRLGWASIPCCTIIGTDEAKAALIEIDENLMRGELSAAERAIHVAKRKEIYEAAHPEAKQGGAPGNVGHGRGKAPKIKVAKSATLIKTTTGDAKRSQRSGRRDATRAKKIPQLAACIGTSLDKGEELDALAKLTPEQQAPLIEQAALGAEVSARPVAAPQGAVLRLVSEVRETNARRHADDHNSETTAVDEYTPDARLRTVIMAIHCAMATKSWKSIAESYVMLCDLHREVTGDEYRPEEPASDLQASA